MMTHGMRSKKYYPEEADGSRDCSFAGTGKKRITLLLQH